MDDNKSMERILGVGGSQFMQVMRTLIDSFENDPISYTYMDSSEFDSLMRRGLKLGSKVYWEELLGRAHLAAATSIIRAYRWSSGMCISYSNSLFLPFCASFRSLIESTADGYDALGNVAATLAECRSMVNEALQLKAAQGLLAKELEDQLIHFSHARKLSKGDTAPATHSAKQAADYVRSLEKANLPRLYECYSELCQYTHPAAYSVVHLLTPSSDGVFLLTPGHDQLRIDSLVEKYRSLMLPLLMFAFNPGVLILKVLLYFDAPQFQSMGIQKIDLSEVNGWKKYAKKMGVPP
jgi:hypothetical protein